MPFQQLHDTDNLCSIRHGNLQVLAAELFMVFKFSPNISNEVFIQRKGPYNLRKNNTIENRQVHFVLHICKMLVLSKYLLM